MNTRDKGNFFETRACSYLEDNGYKILDRNFRVGRYSEIDIVALHEGCLVAVEVKGLDNAMDDDLSTQCIKGKINRLKFLKLKQALIVYSQKDIADFDFMRIDVIMILNSKVFHYKDVSI